MVPLFTQGIKLSMRNIIQTLTVCCNATFRSFHVVLDPTAIYASTAKRTDSWLCDAWFSGVNCLMCSNLNHNQLRKNGFAACRCLFVVILHRNLSIYHACGCATGVIEKIGVFRCKYGSNWKIDKRNNDEKSAVVRGQTAFERRIGNQPSCVAGFYSSYGKTLHAIKAKEFVR